MFLKIGELAQLAGISIEAIRYYEKLGLISPATRGSNNYRHYSAQHVQELNFVSHCREINLSLDTIRQLQGFFNTPQQDCGQVNEIIDNHLVQVNRKIDNMFSLRNQLLNLRNKCSDQVCVQDCGILKELKSIH